MKNSLSKKIFLILVLFCCFRGLAQELPPVVNFGPNQYSAGNQNWMIAQAENQNLYFANSTGLLEYNGESWNLYPVPNNTVVRSLKVVGNRIYIGAYMEAGYWEKDEYGRLQYTSLVPKFSSTISDGEQFWDIEFLDDLIIFRSFGGIYFYDPKQDLITKMDNPLGKPVSGIFKLENELYFQLVGAGLFKVRNGNPELFIPIEDVGEKAVMHLYKKEQNFAIITGKSEFFIWNGNHLIKENQEFNTELGNPNILDAIDLENGGVVLGTVGKGVVQLDANGGIVNIFNQENILMNNTVLDLYMDDSGIIWAGLDYGISSIDLKSTFLSFQDNRGEIGSVYASHKENGTLYLGTNQGLYFKKKKESNFQLIKGTEGQVWFIDKVQNSLLCGHDSGTFIIDGENATKVCDRLGTWIVKEYKDGVFVQGHYNGISFLRKKSGSFEASPMLRDFPHSSKFIEIDEFQNVWVSNEHKGVFKMTINDSLSDIVDIENYTFSEESGITSSMFRYDDTLYYSSKEKIYQYSKDLDSFSKNNRLNAITSDIDRISGKMISEVNRDKLWGFSNEAIFYIEPAQLSTDYNINSIFINQDFRNIAVGYENISAFEDSQYLLGIANGYLRFKDLTAGFREISIKLNRVEVSALDATAEKVRIEQSGEFDSRHNNINFHFSAPVHEKYYETLYSYRLLGLSSNWSAWNDAPEANFKNLGFGDYTFEVKAKIGNSQTKIASYNFSINRPFYLSAIALIGYSLIFLLLLFLIHIINKKHHRKVVAENERALKMKNLEAEQEIIKLKNDKLEQAMANKNRELAVSTMSLIKKNEFLTSIKDKLKESDGSHRVDSVIKTIDKDISEEDNWKFFKKAFSNADKDFFKKIKGKHPVLTSNDLKLCAYLRLNLSSKEIAPLLNISVKSVEIKRYRLRKKMELDRETNLTDYILEL
ncbi:two-component system sensor histidine kinase/response regulator hybrid [Christiangramia forsetii KT0803]|uniref:Two-component system sensor histidine kinase/response regulator hybrid n=1 Tax=Christiangramia forsetii (strain DSM 17595 / CGMCC 1.15422 / KT0803) TaxID=411154 RepID=A0M706_CHRFK|nr:two-component system sensor histidine kinase/response regulator hybrid [Christiangramia forsetii KT0803]